MKNKKIYIFNKDTNIWNDIDTHEQTPILIEDVLKDLKKYNNIEYKIILKKIKYYKKMNNWNSVK